MSKGNKQALRDRADVIFDVAYERIEAVMIKTKTSKSIKMEDALGQVASILCDASNSLDYAISYYVR